MIRRAPESVVPGEPIEVLARVETKATRRFLLTSADGTQAASDRTQAHRSELAYWLGAVPVHPTDAPLTVEVDCGAHSANTTIAVDTGGGTTRCGPRAEPVPR